MSEQEAKQTIVTSTLREALRALNIPDQAVALLAGFRIAAPHGDPLEAGSTS